MRADGYGWFSYQQLILLRRTLRRPFMYAFTKEKIRVQITEITNTPISNTNFTDTFFLGPIVFDGDYIEEQN